MDKYLQVDPDFNHLIESLVQSYETFKVFYFDEQSQVMDQRGSSMAVHKDPAEGEFLVIGENDPVRLERIITINGKIGPAYEQYDAYANACFSCQAGYDE